MSKLINHVSQSLAESGGRMTAQRRLILETLEQLTTAHPTAEEIYQAVHCRAPEVNLSTVYRTLRWLEQQGLVNAHRFAEGDTQGRYDARSRVHHHFICLRCKTVTEFSTPIIQDIMSQYQQEFGGQVQEAELVLRGVCPACLEKEGTSPP